MYAHRQIFENPQAVIPVPAELQNQRIEVIFMQLDEVVDIPPRKTLVDALLAMPNVGRDEDFVRVDTGNVTDVFT